jgi:hypothetical protein
MKDHGSGRLVLQNEQLRVTVTPEVGGTIIAVEHKGLGASVLGTVPWEPEATALEPGAARDETIWLTRYSGGWPVLFPNGGDACEFEGVFHGFHGEASITPWEVTAAGHAGLSLARRFVSLPVEMHREIALEGDVVAVRERVRMFGDRPVRAMWGHHPTFGSDLLAGPFEIQSGARSVTVDDGYDPPGNPLVAGAKGSWPSVPGKQGPYDLRRPEGKLAALAYLRDFASPWISIRRLDNSLGAALSWDQTIFPCAWLWLELGANEAPPWGGRTRLIGLEPNTTWPANGLAEADRCGAPLLALRPGAEMRAWLRLHVFKPRGAVRGVDAEGRALTAGD